MIISNVKIKIIIILSLGWNMGVLAQFNTLNRTAVAPKKNENRIVPAVQIPAENKKLPTAKKTFFQRIFTSEKAQLKKENDSLKRLLNDQKNEKLDFKRIEDSIILNISKKLLFSKLNRQKDAENKENHSLKIAMPLRKKLEVTSPFGMRMHPVFGQEKMHNGIDFRANYEFVQSVLEGEISHTGYDPTSGLFIKVKHTDCLETLLSSLGNLLPKGRKSKGRIYHSKKRKHRCLNRSAFAFRCKRKSTIYKPNNIPKRFTNVKQ